MTSLIAILSSGKGTWAEVNKIISLGNWDRVYLICSEFAYENFKIPTEKALKLKFDEKNPNKSFQALSKFFKKEIGDLEVALNITSGSGIEHMAVISAVLKSGLGIRFVYIENEQLKEFEIFEGNFVSEDEDLGFL